MRKTLLVAVAALLFAVPACIHHHGGWGGPGHRGAAGEPCPQHRRADCPCPEGKPTKDCPKTADCPKAEAAPKAPAPCPNCPNAPKN